MQSQNGGRFPVADHSRGHDHTSFAAGRRLATVLSAPRLRRPGGRPRVPPARVKILRDAYHQSLKDPGLLEELKKRRWVVDAIGGEEMAALAREVIAQPPESIERMKKLLGS